MRGDGEAAEGERRALAALLRLPPPMTCPACGSPDVVPLIFGLPMEPLFRAAELGLVALGGCAVGEDPPSNHCLELGLRLRGESEIRFINISM